MFRRRFRKRQRETERETEKDYSYPIVRYMMRKFEVSYATSFPCARAGVNLSVIVMLELCVVPAASLGWVRILRIGSGFRLPGNSY